MIWLHPGTILLFLLFFYFLYAKSWKVAFAVIGFIFITGRAAALLDHRYGPGHPLHGVALSILLIAGCVWFVVAAVAGRLRGDRNEGRGGGDGAGTG
jgi:hypothetical protein